MSYTPIIVIEVVLVFGCVLAFGLWELRTLRREKERREQAEARARDKAARASGDAAS